MWKHIVHREEACSIDTDIFYNSSGRRGLCDKVVVDPDAAAPPLGFDHMAPAHVSDWNTLFDIQFAVPMRP